jgi:hypothetical protein
MRIISKQLVACTSVLTFGAFSMFAAATHPQNRAAAQNRFWSDVETVLAMTPAQKNQAQMTFDQARQEAQPVRKELKDTTQALKTAVKSNNTSEIQKLSATEGQEIGKLVAIRSSAAAKVYQSLSPDQQTKAEALHQIMMRGFRHELNGAASPSGS